MNMNTNIKRLLYIGTFFCCLYTVAIFVNIWIFFPFMKDVFAIGFLLGSIAFILKPFFNNKKEKKDGKE